MFGFYCICAVAAKVYPIATRSVINFYDIVSIADKCPQLTDFVVLIKSNAESAQLFESIQQDAATSFTTQHSVEAMEVS